MDRSAIISECHQYRYLLRRIWDGKLPMVCFIMLNPSTADGFEDDPTIRRCIGFSKEWGYGGFYVVNLFAFRSTDPKDLLKVEDPVGRNNERYISQYTSASDKIICAWGNHSIVKKLSKKFPNYNPPIAKTLYCLGKNAKGDPKHPLYLKKDLKPILFN